MASVRDLDYAVELSRREYFRPRGGRLVVAQHFSAGDKSQ
jgi:hypothetical protein